MTRIISILILFCGMGASALYAQDVVCVDVPRANLRSGPGTNFEKSWEVSRYMPFIKRGQKGEWLQVEDVDGDWHWIASRLVSDKIQCVTTTASKVNLRRGPSTRAKIWVAATNYTSFQRIGEEGSWIKLRYENNDIWVFNSLVWPDYK